MNGPACGFSSGRRGRVGEAVAEHIDEVGGAGNGKSGNELVLGETIGTAGILEDIGEVISWATTAEYDKEDGDTATETEFSSASVF